MTHFIDVVWNPISLRYACIGNKKIEVTEVYDFPSNSTGKESTCNTGDPGSIPGLGRFPREGNGYPVQYSGLENCMDCIVHEVAKSWTQLSSFHFHFS